MSVPHSGKGPRVFPFSNCPALSVVPHSGNSVVKDPGYFSLSNCPARPARPLPGVFSSQNREARTPVVKEFPGSSRRENQNRPPHNPTAVVKEFPGSSRRENQNRPPHNPTGPILAFLASKKAKKGILIQDAKNQAFMTQKEAHKKVYTQSTGGQPVPFQGFSAHKTAKPGHPSSRSSQALRVAKTRINHHTTLQALFWPS